MDDKNNPIELPTIVTLSAYYEIFKSYKGND